MTKHYNLEITIDNKSHLVGRKNLKKKTLLHKACESCLIDSSPYIHAHMKNCQSLCGGGCGQVFSVSPAALNSFLITK